VAACRRRCRRVVGSSVGSSGRPVRTFLHFRGRAERAGPGCPADLGSASATAPLTGGGAASARSWMASPGNRGRAGPWLPSFAPSGHVGAVAHSVPAAAARAPRRQFSVGAELQERSSLQRRIVKPRKNRGQGRSLRSCRYAIPSGPRTASLAEDSSGAYRRDGRPRTPPEPWTQGGRFSLTVCSNPARRRSHCAMNWFSLSNKR